MSELYPRRWWALLILCLSLFLIVLDNSILNVALPTLVRDLDASNSELQWIVDSYVLVFAGLLLTCGALGDRLGRKSVLSVGLVVFGVGSTLAAFSDSSAQLIATRCLMGVGAALIMPATLSIITNMFTEPKERARAIGVWAGIAGLAIAVGPVAGGWLLEHFWWGSIFLVNVPVVVVALVGGRVLVPDSRDPHRSRPDPVGALLSIAGLVALVWAIIDAPERGWTDGLVIAAFAAAGILLVAFIVWEMRIDHPMLDIGFFRNPRFTVASVAVMLVFFALLGSLFLLTQYLQFVMGYDPLEAGLRLTPWAATMMVVAPSSARLVERVGTKRVMATGLALLAVGLTILSGATVDSGYDRVLVSMLIMATGMGLTMAPATESIMGSLPPARAGVGSAMNDTTRQVGGALGVAVLGSILATSFDARTGDLLRGGSLPLDAASDFVDGMQIGMLVAAVVALVGCVLVALFLPARAPTREEIAPAEPVSA